MTHHQHLFSICCIYGVFHVISIKTNSTLITAAVTGAPRNTRDAVDLSSTVDSVGTHAAIPMLTTTTATDAAGITGASRYTRDAVDLSSTVDSVGTDAAIPS